MTNDDLAETMLKRLGRMPIAELPADERASRVGRMTHVVERAFAKADLERRRRVRAAWALTTLAAAALIVLVAARLAAPRGDVATLVRAAGSVELIAKPGAAPVLAHPGMRLDPHVGLSTAHTSSADVTLSSGARLHIGPATRLRLARDERAALAERIELGGGRVDFDVPKLGTGRLLSIETADALVTVRGTRFSVVVENATGARVTLVSVEQGRVEVDHASEHVVLTAGQSWSSARPLASMDKGAHAASEQALAPRAPAARDTSDRRAPVTPPAARYADPKHENGASRDAEQPADASTLAEETRLFERALRNARSGQKSQALRDLERFQREHPRSTLMQAVRVEYLHLLKETGDEARAAREARRYLADYPNGFARDEAKSIALFGTESRP